MRAPISVTMIVRDEALRLERCLNSFIDHVQELVIIDTGSTDDTVKIADSFADRVDSYFCREFSGCNDESGRIADFASARNYALKYVSRPWVMWVDADDIVVGADRLSALVSNYTEQCRGGACQVLMPYEYARDGTGQVTCLYDRERLVSPSDKFKWVGEVHEVLIGPPSTQIFRTDQVHVQHERDFGFAAKDPQRNLRILRRMANKSDPLAGISDPRTLYYLGLELANAGEMPEAVDRLTQYVEWSGWDDERYFASLKIASIYSSQGLLNEAVEWALRATTIKVRWGEAYFVLARCFAGMGGVKNWEKSLQFAQLGMSMPATVTTLFMNPQERAVEIPALMVKACKILAKIAPAAPLPEALQGVLPADAVFARLEWQFGTDEAKKRFREAMEAELRSTVQLQIQSGKLAPGAYVFEGELPARAG